jgi:hypothetical protein
MREQFIRFATCLSTVSDAALPRGARNRSKHLTLALVGAQRRVPMRHLTLGLAAGSLLFGAVTIGNAETIVETTGVAPPDEVVTYVERERVPSVRVEGDVTTGYALPDTVEIRTIPRHQQYGYAVINERRVIVDPGSRKVIRVLG